ncbi:beige protein, putative [Entamoeba invadens IP1]|uniref:beige protein, putative n=1 Tax=Entamoeba invadens IP1 TaxID=370355 RepID=UPI0002C3DC8D|nr:beige protein, putative [Entamoeba invadens IP1]ELP90591.1 beige protein, putative [Entamoeba invadens IP1]|eukprot:XP_004257362.1 beige protein, putative [Entamoeba invadens IP1]
MSLFKSFLKPREVQPRNENVTSFNKHYTIYLSNHHVSEIEKCMELFFKIPSPTIQSIPTLSSFTQTLIAIFDQTLNQVDQSSIEWLNGIHRQNSPNGQDLFRCIRDIAQFGNVEQISLFSTTQFLTKITELYTFLVDVSRDENDPLLSQLMSLIILTVPQSPRFSLPSGLLVLRFDKPETQINLLPVFQTVTHAHMTPDLLLTVSREGSVGKTISTLNQAKASTDVLRLLESYLGFVRSTAYVSDAISTYLTKNGFYEATLRILIEADKNHLKEVDGVLDVIAPLMFFGDFSPHIEQFQRYNDNTRILANRYPYFLVKNKHVPLFLQNYCLKTERQEGKLHTMKLIERMFRENPMNYAALSTIDYTQRFFFIFNDVSQVVRDTMLSVCVYLSRCQKFIPFPEVKTIATHLNPQSVEKTPQLINSFNYLISQLLVDNKKYQKVFQESEMTKNAVETFNYFVEHLEEGNASTLIVGVIRILALLVDKSNENFEEIKKANAMKQALLLFKTNANFRGELTKLFLTAIEFFNELEMKQFVRNLIEPLEEDISPISLLRSLCVMLYRSNGVKECFRQLGGFTFYQRFYAKWGWDMSTVPQHVDDNQYMLMEWSFIAIIYSMKGSKDNRKHFDDTYKQNNVMNRIVENCGFLKEEKYQERMCCLLIAIIFEITDIEKVKALGLFDKPMGGVLIYHPFVLHALLKAVHSSLPLQQQKSVLNFLSTIAREDVNVRKMAAENLTSTVINDFIEDIKTQSELHQNVLDFLVQLISYDIKKEDVSVLLKTLKAQPYDEGIVQCILDSVMKSDRNGALSFNTAPIGYSCISVPINKSMFPLPQFSIVLWTNLPMINSELYLFQILQVVNGIEQNGLSISVTSEGLRVVYGAKTMFEKVQLPRKWNHIGVVCKSKKIVLYVNGLLKATEKIVAFNPTVYRCVIGHSKENKVIPNAVFKIGPLKMLDFALNDQQVRDLYLLGEMYQGTFQTTDYSQYEVLPNYDENDVNVIQSFSTVGTFTLSMLNLNIPVPSMVVNSDHILSNFAMNSCTTFGTVNTASPNDLTDGIFQVGGVVVLLALILKSDTPDKMNKSLKLLLAALRKSEGLFREMKRIKGFELLNLFIYKKAKLMSTDSLLVLLSFAGVDPSKRDSAVIASPQIFDTLVLDFSLFYQFENPQTVILYVLQSFVSLIYNNKYAQVNISILRSLHFLSRLIDLFQDDIVDDEVIQITINLLQHFLLNSCTTDDVKHFVRLVFHFISIIDSKTSTATLLKKTEIRFISLMKLVLCLATNLKDKQVLLSVFTPAVLFHIFSAQSIPKSILLLTLKVAASLMAVASQSKNTFSSQFVKDKGILFVTYQLKRCVDSTETVFSLLGLITNQIVPDVSSSTFAQYKKMPFSNGPVQSPEYISSIIKLLRLQMVEYNKEKDQKMVELIELTSGVICDLMEKPEIYNYVFAECLSEYISIFVGENGYFKMGDDLEVYYRKLLFGLGVAFATQMIQNPTKSVIAHELLYENSSFLSEEEESEFLGEMLTGIGMSVLNQLNADVAIDRVSTYMSLFMNGRIDFILTKVTRKQELISVLRDDIKYIKIVQLSGRKGRGIYPLYDVLNRIVLLTFDRNQQEEIECIIEMINREVEVIFNEVNANEQFVHMLLHGVLRIFYENDGVYQLTLGSFIRTVISKRTNLINKIFQTRPSLQNGLVALLDMPSNDATEWIITNKDEVLKGDVECLLKYSTQWMTDESTHLSSFKTPLEQRRTDRINLNKQSDVQCLEAIKKIQHKNKQLRERVSVLIKEEAEKTVEHFRAIHAQSQGAWEAVAETLFLEKGIWWDGNPCLWTLDNVEGPCRMRKRLVRDTDFTSRYSTTSKDGFIDVELNKMHKDKSYEIPEYLVVKDEVEIAETYTMTPSPKIEESLHKRRGTFSGEDDIYKMMKTSLNKNMNFGLIETGDDVKSRFNCFVINGMDKISCIFIVCTQAVYVVEGLELRRESIIAKGTVKTERIPAEDIQNIASRRFMLRNIAVELFVSGGRNKLIIFEDGYEAAMKSLAPFKQKQEDMTSGIHQEKKTILAPLKIFNQMDPMTAKWVEGKISNFYYLMYLNTKSGRTFNDVTQYPVMPWVIADYSSENINLQDQRIYRDLSKPMGALTPERAENTIERFEAVKDNPEMAFHYGSHYTSVGVTLYYLIRCEPFSHFGIELQGGRFDLADRLFNSLEDLWKLLSGPTVKQVMELIPEFFYFPEFLRNFDKFDLKKRNDGTLQVDDVVLPKWARGSYRRFVRTNMMALESPYVSAHLHEWIDLIFGYKQQGEAALKALNLFHPSSYEGGVDMKSVVDEKLKKAYEDMIINFGQTPIQIFKQPHPKRTVPKTGFQYGVLLAENWDIVVTKQHNFPVLSFSVIQQNFVGLPSIIPIEKGGKLLTFTEDGTITVTQNGKTYGVIENVSTPGKIVCSVCDSRIVCGTRDGIIIVYETINGLKEIGRMRGHQRAVEAVDICKEYSIIVSGDESGEIIEWDLHTYKIIRSFNHGEKIHLVKTQTETGDIVTLSKTLLKHWTINGDFIQSIQLSNPPTEALIPNIPEWIPGHILLTGHTDGTIDVWRLDESICLGDGDCPTHQHEPKLLKQHHIHEGKVTALSLSDDFTTLYVGYEDGTAVKVM